MLQSNELILLFYKFLVVYERVLKDESKDSLLQKSFPNSFAQLKATFVHVNKRSIKDLQNENLDNVEIGRGYYSQRDKTNKMLSICYHIRNSFAHTLLQSNDEAFVITDKNHDKISAYFKINCDELMNVLNSIIEESNLF